LPSDQLLLVQLDGKAQMSLQRLRRILDSTFTVLVDSSAATIQRVQKKIDARAGAFQAKNKTAPPTKTPTIVASLAGFPSVTIRPIDFLRKIGDLTTPSDVNMASLSASWATRRYFWAIAEPRGRTRRFRLSDDARAMDFHQKTLLSDEFGIGFGGLLMERLFNAGLAIDVSAALQNPGQFQNVVQSGSAQPDYLMWDPAPNTPYYVVECKGCQTSRDATMGQIRRGLEQVPSLILRAGGRPVVTLVVASHMQASKTTVYIIDPPDTPPDDTDPGERQPPNERIRKNTWRINNPEEFARTAQSTNAAKLLNWVGQFESASRLLARIRRTERRTEARPDLPLTRRRVADLYYYGRRLALFPELGYPRLRIFLGIHEDVLARARTSVGEAGHPTDIPLANTILPHTTEDPNVSVGKDGTCLLVEGV
jgi:hypothetical protein